MALTPKQNHRIHELYTALTQRKQYVAEIYGVDPPQDPLRRHSNASNNTFLHMAIRFRQFELVDLFLQKLPEKHEHEESLSNIKNDDGNTLLHELAANDDSADRAHKLVRKDPELLIALNKLKETPIFSAARHDRVSMFRYLARKLKQHYPEDVKKHLQRDGRTTVLHIAIAAEHFDLAYAIAENHQDLIIEKDQDGMTAFQHLACNQRAFSKKKKKREGFLEDRTSGLKMSQDDRPVKDKFKEAFFCTYVPKRDDSLRSLVRLLVTKDATWHTSTDSHTIGSCKSKELKGGIMESDEIELATKMNAEESHGRKISRKESTIVGNRERSYVFQKDDESPLFLAVMSNIPEIVKEILLQSPYVLHHTNKEGMNILQVAILFGNVKIFDLVVDSEVLPDSLLSAVDDEGNSLAHMVGLIKTREATERLQNPAMHLRKECIFFQKVKSACNMHLIKPLNDNHQTAEELFAAANEKLHQEAKEWILRTTENCTILSVFIATVAFAAVYTVPGGPDQSTGIPLLNSKPFFVIFVIADVISLTLALTSVGIFLSILTSSFPLQDFETYLFQKLKRGILSMMLSVSMMAVAFGATVVLIMTNNWENAFWIVVGFLPVPIFFLSYSPLRSAALEHLKESFTTFAARFLFLALALLIIILAFPQLVFRGLGWIMARAFMFIKRKVDSCTVDVGKNQESRQLSQV